MACAEPGFRRSLGPCTAAIGTIADITERKEREEKEHLLMREINRRAKNMLSVMDAIAHQKRSTLVGTAARSPEDFVERLSDRVQALSANQDLLVRNEWKGGAIADLVRAQLAHFADLIGSRIESRHRVRHQGSAGRCVQAHHNPRRRLLGSRCRSEYCASSML
jgi:two-component sensor histidine kinase